MAYNFLPCVRDQGFLLPPDLRLLIAPAKHAREGKPRKDGGPSASRSTGLRVAMEAKLTSPEGKARYKLRKQTIEPVFGQIRDPWCPPVPAARPGRLHGRMAASVWDPQPAQALASRPEDDLSDGPAAQRSPQAVGDPVDHPGWNQCPPRGTKRCQLMPPFPTQAATCQQSCRSSRAIT
jgi:hypothetical protein